MTTPSSPAATRSFSANFSTKISASSWASSECASSVTIRGPDTTRNERGSMRPFVPTLWANQS
eukprot:15456500-Alexandrium_andersonii.AAC.1